MRAKSTLVAACVLMGAFAAAPAAEASSRDQRQSQVQRQAGKAFRPAAPASATRQQAAAKPASRQVAAQAARRPATQAAARPGVAPQVIAMPRAAGPQAIQRPSVIMPQAQAQQALLSPAVARNMGGTPILPVSVSSGLSCVPFARMATGMNISGNARDWWHNAAGAYLRGQSPERGAILSFPASGGMGSGHVAVVSRVVNARTIEIDHANWAGPGIRRGTVIRGAVVVDVSDRNDWTAVRVQVGYDRDTFGRTYATHGFIYNRPVPGGRILSVGLRPMEEVAEAPHAALHQRYALQGLAE